MLRMCVVADYDPENVTHIASTSALQHAAKSIGQDISVEWTPTIEITADTAPQLQGADAFLIAPASPYRNMDGALLAITYARTHDIPLLGTCGGFQHLVVEFARNVLGIRDAEHAESSPDALTQVITPRHARCSASGWTSTCVPARGHSEPTGALGRRSVSTATSASTQPMSASSRPRDSW